MQIELPMKILQVAVTVDKAWQDGFASDVDHLRATGNGDFAALADGLELSRLDNDRRILDRRPARAVDQFPTLNHERCFCHSFYSFLDSDLRIEAWERSALKMTAGICPSLNPKYLIDRFAVNAAVAMVNCASGLSRRLLGANMVEKEKRIMTAKSDFTTDEWKAIVAAAPMVGLAVTGASPNGPWGVMKEMLSMGMAMAEMLQKGRSNPLIAA